MLSSTRSVALTLKVASRRPLSGHDGYEKFSLESDDGLKYTELREETKPNHYQQRPDLHTSHLKAPMSTQKNRSLRKGLVLAVSCTIQDLAVQIAYSSGQCQLCSASISYCQVWKPSFRGTMGGRSQSGAVCSRRVKWHWHVMQGGSHRSSKTGHVWPKRFP